MFEHILSGTEKYASEKHFQLPSFPVLFFFHDQKPVAVGSMYLSELIEI